MILDPPPYLRVNSADCSLGVVVIAESQRGLRAIFLGDKLSSVILDLKKHFPTSTIIHDEIKLKNKTNIVCQHIDNPRIKFDFLLDLQGSCFQLQVWNSIMSVPIGKTATYKEIAKKIDRPKAIRAVARACANNMLALVIPCHRVVGYDGSLCGYRWGIHRKKILIEREKNLL